MWLFPRFLCLTTCPRIRELQAALPKATSTAGKLSRPCVCVISGYLSPRVSCCENVLFGSFARAACARPVCGAEHHATLRVLLGELCLFLYGIRTFSCRRVGSFVMGHRGRAKHIFVLFPRAGQAASRPKIITINVFRTRGSRAPF